jgi:outer membrane protein assembly factor BamD
MGRQQQVIQPVDPELLNLSKEEVFEQAEKHYEQGRYVRARRYFAHVYENYPNDPLGRRALLRVADTYYKQGDAVNLVEAQYKYRDFINRYPGSELADYAMLQIANVSYKQMERPDRDQTRTREAVEKFREMLASYPNSKYRPEAEKKLQETLDRLAKHEHMIAAFYRNRGNHDAAIRRLNGILERFPNYADRDEVFYDLATSLQAMGRTGEARLYFERVIAEFPDSDFAKRARQKLANETAG